MRRVRYIIGTEERVVLQYICIDRYTYIYIYVEEANIDIHSQIIIFFRQILRCILVYSRYVERESQNNSDIEFIESPIVTNSFATHQSHAAMTCGWLWVRCFLLWCFLTSCFIERYLHVRCFFPAFLERKICKFTVKLMNNELWTNFSYPGVWKDPGSTWNWMSGHNHRFSQVRDDMPGLDCCYRTWCDTGQR